MTRASVGALILLVSAGPVFAYEEDTHYYLCFLAARMSGLSANDAHIVASASQAIDEAPGTTPLQWSNFARKGPGELDRLKRVLPLWHAMSATGNEADITKRMGELRETAFQGKGDLIGLGRYAHFAQDWYSHQPEKGRHYTAPYGHGADEHFPDYLATDPKKAAEMARSWMKDVAEFVKATGRPPAPPQGIRDGASDKLLGMILDRLIVAKHRKLSHEELERTLNEFLKSQGVDLVVPAYDRRIAYAFEEDGTPHPVDLERDLPPMVVRIDAASRRFYDRAREDAALAGARVADTARVALDALQRLQAMRLEELALAARESRLAALRRQLRELKAERDRLDQEIPPLEAEIERLVNPAKGPCICGAATHSVCKKGKECQDVENGMRNQLVDQVRPKKARRTAIPALIDGLMKSIEAEESAIRELKALLFPEPAPVLKNRLEPDAVLSPRLRQALPAILPYLPPEAMISSGLRTPERQLRAMRDEARKHQIPWRDDAAVDRPETWMEAWHALLAKGAVVNPPVAARKADGTLVPPSPHLKGNSFDVKGAPLDQIMAGLEKAVESGVASLKYKPEPNNGRTGVVHVDIRD